MDRKSAPFVIALLLSAGLVRMTVGHEASGSTAADSKPGAESRFHYGRGELNRSELAGAEIWLKATAGNERFFTYVYPQRFGTAVDWYRVLNTESREERFYRWGLINDPDCCRPGDRDCPAKSRDETYGFDYCPGDETLLQYVGKPGYRDPSCDFKDAPLPPNDPHGPKDQRQSACDLRFGTSTGALGIRKFPNPRFDRHRWLERNKQPGIWSGYNERLPRRDPSRPPISRIMDGSLEPPFLIGISCGSCHIGFDPLNPPKNPARPAWDNLSGTVGNQYSRFSQILGSGISPSAIEYQVFAHARPGTVDTSALPNDQINNPGTINAIINFATRPTFPQDIIKWRKTAACAKGADERACWCEPGKDRKCWERGKQTEPAPHMLKGGEDSIGFHEALQRVYVNIGSCAEESWVNHLTDMRQLDLSQRGFGQTPLDIGQARRDCPSFRAVEDRLDDLLNFLLSGRPTDLYRARGLKSRRDLIEQLDAEFGRGAVERGRVLFAKLCARCHSSRPEPFETRDVHAASKNPADKGIRIDWLGNDKAIPVSEIGTHQARALHSNHMAGHIWEEYGSETLRGRPADPIIREPSDGGRGYYRNISLLSVWAHAPFMHNNAIGPEICGGVPDEHYTSPYVDEAGHPLPDPPGCRRFDPSVEGRFSLFKASMHELLYPQTRIPKVTRFDRPVTITLPLAVRNGNEVRYAAATIVFPPGTPSSRIGNFRHKEFANDVLLAQVDPAKLREKYGARYGSRNGEPIAVAIEDAARTLLDNPARLLEVGGELRALYSNSLALRENDGHRFGEDLSDTDKNALIAFLATL